MLDCCKLLSKSCLRGLLGWGVALPYIMQRHGLTTDRVVIKAAPVTSLCRLFVGIAWLYTLFNHTLQMVIRFSATLIYLIYFRVRVKNLFFLLCVQDFL